MCLLPLVGTTLLLLLRDKCHSMMKSTHIHIVMEGRCDKFMKINQFMMSIYIITLVNFIS